MAKITDEVRADRDIANAKQSYAALTAKLPSTALARLPATYEAAKTAIAKCVEIDECKDWADKAAALASYAKQAEDDELLKQCTRIKARAMQRCGELLKGIGPKKGGRPKTGADTDTNSSVRKKVADAAGLSPRQAVTAVRVANVPAESFERQIESDAPPTVTELARQGTKSVPLADVLAGRDPDDFKMATRLLGHLSRFTEPIGEFNVAQAKRGMNKAELRRAVVFATTAMKWTKRVTETLVSANPAKMSGVMAKCNATVKHAKLDHRPERRARPR
jgi:hypothetical protein